MERGNLDVDANGEATSGVNHEGESTNATPRGGGGVGHNSLAMPETEAETFISVMWPLGSVLSAKHFA